MTTSKPVTISKLSFPNDVFTYMNPPPKPTHKL